MIETIKGKENISFIKLVDDVKEAIEAVSFEPESRILWIDFSEVKRSLIEELLESKDLLKIKRVRFGDHSDLIKKFSNFNHWTTLSFGFKNSVFDFSNQKSLVQLGGVWSKNWSGLSGCIKLETFHVSAFEDEVGHIPNIVNLSKIVLIQPKISSLKGIELARNLKELELTLANRLYEISQFSSKNGLLENLIIDGCKKIESYDSIANLRALKHLAILNSNTIDSLSIVEQLPELIFINLYNTKLIEVDTVRLLSTKTQVHGIKEKIK